MKNNLVIPFVCAKNSAAANVFNVKSEKNVAFLKHNCDLSHNRVIDTLPYPWIKLGIWCMITKSLPSTIITKSIDLILVPDVPEAQWEILPGGGLKVMVPDQQGQTLVYLQFNINKPLPGFATGDYDIMIRYYFAKLIIISFLHNAFRFFSVLLNMASGHMKMQVSK